MSHNMRMSKDHYEELKHLCQEVMTRSGMSKQGMVARMDKRPAVKDAEKAARWEMMWRACDIGDAFRAGDYRRGGFAQKWYDAGLNDDHLDTALRRIWAELGEADGE